MNLKLSRYEFDRNKHTFAYWNIIHETSSFEYAYIKKNSICIFCILKGAYTMKSYKSIMIAAAALLSWPMAAHAESCNTSMTGPITKLTMENDAKFFTVSFGDHYDVPVWHNLTENEGQAAFEMLRDGAINGAVLQVQSCNSNGSIMGMSIQRRGR